MTEILKSRSLGATYRPKIEETNTLSFISPKAEINVRPLMLLQRQKKKVPNVVGPVKCKIGLSAFFRRSLPEVNELSEDNEEQ